MIGATTLSQKATILVVDDTPQSLFLIADPLETDYTVKVASGGAKELKIAQCEVAPDLILLDIVMPDMDGFEVCRRLKENPQRRHCAGALRRSRPRRAVAVHDRREIPAARLWRAGHAAPD